MAVKESKAIVNFVTTKEIKAKLQEMADKEGRSLSGMVNKMIMDYLANIEK